MKNKMFVGNYECTVRDGKLKLPETYEYSQYLYCVCYESDGAMILSFSNVKNDERDVPVDRPLFEQEITVKDRWMTLPKKFMNHASNQQIMFAGLDTEFEILTKNDLEKLSYDEKTYNELAQIIDEIL